MGTNSIVQHRVKLVREKTVRYPVGRVDDSECAARILHAMLDDSDREKVCVIYLNGQNQPTGCEVVGVGGLSSCGIGAKEILRGAILANASGFVLGHNHPSGDPTPSEEDKALTRHVSAAAHIVGVPLLDHIVVAPNGKHVSFFEKGLL